jgi:hypothetical protein
MSSSPSPKEDEPMLHVLVDVEETQASAPGISTFEKAA